jgi:alpha-D-glucose phosphate-specific phosphoglucomutase
LQVSFGTDGWRGLIADDFTFENVRIAAAAIARYVVANEEPSRGILIGYDTRFMSRRFAEVAAEVLAGGGIPVTLASGITPTPALSYAVRQRGAAGGVMITSSHNPAQWNGVKYKASYGGSGSPSIMAGIAAELGKPAPVAATAAKIEAADFVPEYVAAITEFADLKKIAASGYKFAVDCMYGAGRGILAGIFAKHGIPYVEIRAEIDPTFRGISPEPVDPNMRALQDVVVRDGCAAGFATDGDADRIGAVDEHGEIVDSHKLFSILLEWLLERRGWPGEVVRAFNTTKMLDRIAAAHGRKMHEVGIGFKYVCDLMLTNDILIGGEESGGIGLARHLPERDGLLNCLLVAQVMAEEGKTLAELVAGLQAKYGEHYYGRLDLHIPEAQKKDAVRRAQGELEAFAGMKILRRESLDGSKFFLENPEAATKKNAAETWLLFRASGTEPLLRIYAESCSPEAVEKLLQAGRRFALRS